MLPLHKVPPLLRGACMGQGHCGRQGLAVDGYKADVPMARAYCIPGMRLCNGLGSLMHPPALPLPQDTLPTPSPISIPLLSSSAPAPAPSCHFPGAARPSQPFVPLSSILLFV